MIVYLAFFHRDRNGKKSFFQQWINTSEEQVVYVIEWKTNILITNSHISIREYHARILKHEISSNLIIEPRLEFLFFGVSKHEISLRQEIAKLIRDFALTALTTWAMLFLFYFPRRICFLFSQSMCNLIEHVGIKKNLWKKRSPWCLQGPKPLLGCLGEMDQA